MHESRYTFGYVGDEFLYAQRVQPLIAGTTATNTMNGVGDPAVISPFYLEDSVRAFLTVTKIDTISFIWIWRWLFPLAFAGTFVLLARQCLPRERRTWNSALRFSAAAVFPLLYCAYDLVTPFPPLQGFVNRFPTNIEYPLSVLLAWLYLAFLQSPTAAAGIKLALLSALIAYIRPYLAFPWSITIIAGFGYLIAGKKIGARVILATGFTLLLAMGPWMYVSKTNGNSPVFADMLHRYFGSPGSFEVHKLWWMYLAFAFVLAVCAVFVERSRRVFVVGATLTLIVLPFICSSMPFASEVLQFDRFGSYYLVVSLAGVLLAIGSRSSRWRGKRGEAYAKKMGSTLLGASVFASGILALINVTYDFAQYPQGPIPSIRRDLPFVPAYTWLRENSPRDALVLVDDGYDWSINPKRTPSGLPIVSGFAPDGTYILANDDVFQLVARRRRVYTHRLMTCVLSTKDLTQLAYLQRGTFGLPIPKERYDTALQNFRPSYILWRKNAGAPVPRGFGATLKPISSTVYQDDVCEIWKLDIPPSQK